jgi:flagellar biosynthetic protein FliR
MTLAQFALSLPGLSPSAALSLSFPQEDLLRFLFLTVRLGAMVLTLPLLNSPQVPAPVKIVFTFVLSFGLYPTVHKAPLVLPPHFWSLGLLMLGELFIGLTIGFVAQVLFAGIQLGGEIMGQQMGLNVSTMFDPHGTQQLSVVGNFHYILAVLMFFAGSAHHWFILTMAESVHSIPLLAFTVPTSVVTAAVTVLGKAFIMAIQLAAPVMIALLLATLALGILSRLVPQLNVFMLSFPVTFGLGLLVLGWTLPYLLGGFQALFERLGTDLLQVMQLFSQ